MAIDANGQYDGSLDYDASVSNFPVVMAGILDSPGTWLYLNDEWRGFVFGIVSRLLWSDVWASDTDFDIAEQQIQAWFAQTIGEYSVTLCESIAECIATSTMTQNTINQLFLDNGDSAASGGSNTQPLSDAVQTENMLPDVYTCDRDHAFGMARGIVQAIHDATTEVFQLIEVATNPLEIAAELGDNIPGVGIAASGPDVVNWIQDSAYETYLLAWNPALYDSLSCQVFCKIIENGGCSISFKELVEIYALPFAEIPPAGSTLKEIIDFILTIPAIAGETFVKACDLFGLVLMQYGGKYGRLALGVRSLKTVMAMLADDTDPDHAIVCGSCPGEWTIEADLTLSDGSFVVVPGHNSGKPGTYSAGQGWIHTVVISGTLTGVVMAVPLGVLGTLTGMEVEYDYTQGGKWEAVVTNGLSVTDDITIATGGRGMSTWSANSEPTTVGRVRTATGNIPLVANDHAKVQIISALFYGTPRIAYGAVRIYRVRLSGSGDTPNIPGWTVL